MYKNETTPFYRHAHARKRRETSLQYEESDVGSAVWRIGRRQSCCKCGEARGFALITQAYSYMDVPIPVSSLDSALAEFWYGKHKSSICVEDDWHCEY